MPAGVGDLNGAAGVWSHEADAALLFQIPQDRHEMRGEGGDGPFLVRRIGSFGNLRIKIQTHKIVLRPLDGFEQAKEAELLNGKKHKINPFSGEMLQA